MLSFQEKKCELCRPIVSELAFSLFWHSSLSPFMGIFRHYDRNISLIANHYKYVQISLLFYFIFCKNDTLRSKIKGNQLRITRWEYHQVNQASKTFRSSFSDHRYCHPCPYGMTIWHVDGTASSKPIFNVKEPMTFEKENTTKTSFHHQN
jgi:hypothetical protein